MRTPHPTLTPQELAIMKVVWRLEKATVRDVYEALRERRGSRLHHRDDDDEDSRGQGLSQEDAGRPGPRLPAGPPAQQVVGAMVRDFVDRVFDGAAGALLLQLAKDGHLTKAERQHIRQVMDDMEE